MYQVLARKWRPQTLDELVGQPHVARTLRNALNARRVAHAYVFAGVRGTGKTTVARILAKSLNCESGPTATPCNRCVPCGEITEGRSLDVMELDAASRTGVDNIRELQEVVSYAPVRDRYRVLIIDEAHMLSKAAFNALLKTLEEPPPQVVFVLATTEFQRLLPTILSRCQVFEFHRVSTKDVTLHLQRVAGTEGITVSERTLERIARTGEGSMRDALSVLERVLAFCGSEIADDEALQVLGAVRTEVLAEFVRGFATRDAAALLASLDALVNEGHDLVHFWGELIGVVRDLMLMTTWSDAGTVISRTPEEAATLGAAGGELSIEDWTRIFQILAALEHPLKTSSQPRFLFEGALIRLAGLGAVRPIEEILSSLGASTSHPAAGHAPRAGDSERIARGVPSAFPQKKNLAEPPLAQPTAVPRREMESAPGRPQMALALEEVREALVAAVSQARPMLGAMLEQATTIIVDGPSLSIAFGPGDDGLRRMLASDDNKHAIESLAATALGRPLSLRLAGPADERPSPTATGFAGAQEEPSGSTPSTIRSFFVDEGASKVALMERARKDPAVQCLLREFGAQIIDIRPLRAPAESDGPAPTIEENA